MSLTQYQQDYIIKHFSNTKNGALMAKLNISHSSLHRFARLHSLKKTRQFQKKCQLNAALAARKVNERNNWPPKGYRIPRSEEFQFKSGITPEQRLGKKKNADRIRKSADKRRETVKSEKRRVLFGLPQRTKLKVIAAPHAKASYRHVLRKRGYIANRGDREIFYNEATNRSEIVERTAQQKYKFTITKMAI